MINAKEPNCNQLEVLVDDKKAMYVFNRGFDTFVDEGIFFISQLKKKAIAHPVGETFKLTEGSDAVSDTMAFAGNYFSTLFSH